MIVNVNIPGKEYPIYIENGGLNKANKLFDLDRKVLIITDSGVPKKYAETLLPQCKEGFLYTVEQGEESKSFAVFEKICEKLLELKFSRKDAVVALGGGVVGDLSGFVAATYMRGIDFYGIPTTTLSQIDSSIGGKMAINLNKVKNIIGSFYQPKAVLIDHDTLKTLDERQYMNGLVEALKAGLIYDKDIIDLFLGDLKENTPSIILKSVLVKKDVVEKDEKELSLRRILNFGHTIGHGVETIYGFGGLLHGECVAICMLPMLDDENLRAKVKDIIENKLHINTSITIDKDKVFDVITRDKKAESSFINIVKVKEAGTAYQEKIPVEEIKPYLDLINN